MSATPDQPMFVGAPPAWALTRPKPLWQSLHDLLGAPLRMAMLPDHISERLHLTSLRAERLALVLREIEGRCLDIGAGDNMLIRLHRQRAAGTTAQTRADASVGVDVFDWGGDALIVENCRTLPFEDGAFDTVCLIACLNHIPERRDALHEAHRVLGPGGKLIVTMIGRLIGEVGHAIWWYSEDKHREHQDGEVMGMNPSEVERLIADAGFAKLRRLRFLYGLNTMFLAARP